MPRASRPRSATANPITGVTATPANPITRPASASVSGPTTNGSKVTSNVREAFRDQQRKPSVDKGATNQKAVAAVQEITAVTSTNQKAVAAVKEITAATSTLSISAPPFTPAANTAATAATAAIATSAALSVSSTARKTSDPILGTNANYGSANYGKSKFAGQIKTRDVSDLNPFSHAERPVSNAPPTSRGNNKPRQVSAENPFSQASRPATAPAGKARVAPPAPKVEQLKKAKGGPAASVKGVPAKSAAAAPAPGPPAPAQPVLAPSSSYAAAAASAPKPAGVSTKKINNTPRVGNQSTFNPVTGGPSDPNEPDMYRNISTFRNGKEYIIGGARKKYSSPAASQKVNVFNVAASTAEEQPDKRVRGSAVFSPENKAKIPANPVEKKSGKRVSQIGNAPAKGDAGVDASTGAGAKSQKQSRPNTAQSSKKNFVSKDSIFYRPETAPPSKSDGAGALSGHADEQAQRIAEKREVSKDGGKKVLAKQDTLVSFDGSLANKNPADRPEQPNRHKKPVDVPAAKASGVVPAGGTFVDPRTLPEERNTTRQLGGGRGKKRFIPGQTNTEIVARGLQTFSEQSLAAVAVDIVNTTAVTAAAVTTTAAATDGGVAVKRVRRPSEDVVTDKIKPSVLPISSAKKPPPTALAVSPANPPAPAPAQPSAAASKGSLKVPLKDMPPVLTPTGDVDAPQLPAHPAPLKAKPSNKTPAKAKPETKEDSRDKPNPQKVKAATQKTPSKVGAAPAAATGAPVNPKINKTPVKGITVPVRQPTAAAAAATAAPVANSTTSTPVKAAAPPSAKTPLANMAPVLGKDQPVPKGPVSRRASESSDALTSAGKKTVTALADMNPVLAPNQPVPKAELVRTNSESKDATQPAKKEPTAVTPAEQQTAAPASKSNGAKVVTPMSKPTPQPASTGKSTTKDPAVPKMQILNNLQDAEKRLIK